MLCDPEKIICPLEAQDYTSVKIGKEICNRDLCGKAKYIKYIDKVLLKSDIRSLEKMIRGLHIRTPV